MGRRLWTLVLVLAPTFPAGAYEDELATSVEAGYAHLVGDELGGPGIEGGLGLRYGLTDAWNLYSVAGYSLHPSHGGIETTQVGLLAAGVEWVFDVLQIIPYAALGLEGMLTASSDVEPSIGAQIGGGVDYLLSRGLAVGVVVRYHAPLSRLSELPVYLTVGLRLVFGLSD